MLNNILFRTFYHIYNHRTHVIIEMALTAWLK